MTLGYPTEDGAYWVRTYEFNSDSLKYDIKDPKWNMVWVRNNGTFQYTGNESVDDVRFIYEYEKVKKPT